MSKDKDNGGPAFPTVMVHWNGAMIDRGPGMSLRDYFASHTMHYFVGRNEANQAAELSYRYADAMLKERSKLK